MEFIAHRAGNDPALLRDAEQRGADAVEVDVHLSGRDRLEVRHGKRLWPTARLWEKWYLLPSAASVPSLQEILDAAEPSTQLWLDLKGPDPRLARQVFATIQGRHPLIVSTKAWWLLKRFGDVVGIRTVRSAGNRFELFLLLWLPSRSKVDGAVVAYRLLSPQVLARLLRRGLVFTWGVDDAAAIQALSDGGVTGVILDDLGLMAAG